MGRQLYTSLFASVNRRFNGHLAKAKSVMKMAGIAMMRSDCKILQKIEIRPLTQFALSAHKWLQSLPDSSDPIIYGR